MGDAGFKLLGIWGPLTLATIISIVATGDAGALSVGLAAIILGWGFAIARVAWEVAGRRAFNKYGRLVDQLTAEVERLALPAEAKEE
jgi:hypothetical protein